MGSEKLSFMLLVCFITCNLQADQSNQDIQKDQPEQQEGITTLNLQEGNWFIKRQVLEKTMDLLETINTLFSTILQSRMDFLTSRNSVDREFDLFSKKTGFELGDLTQMITSFIEQMQKERDKIGELSAEERSFLESMEQKSILLSSMNDSLSKIADMDASIDDVLLQIEQEINKSHEQQTMALRNFRTIKTILNDQKAEELYLSTKNILENMQEIQKYINGQLKTYFETNVAQLKNIMHSSTEQLQSLKKEGIDLKKTLENFINKDTLQAQQRQQEEHDIQEQLKKFKKVKEQHSITQKITTTIAYPFRWLASWWSNK